MKTKLDRIISIATLVASLTAIFLVLRRPAPVAQPQGSTIGTHAQALNQKADQPEPPAKPAQQSQANGASSAAPSASQNSQVPQGSKVERQINSGEISAALGQMLGASGTGLTPDSDVGSGVPNIKDQKVTYDGDMVHGQFLTEIGGKDVWITISGRMGQKDGYATFDPTEFKVGDLDVPVSLVNPALQRKLAEERDRLKMGDPAGAK
jgi:hypothetical protein